MKARTRRIVLCSLAAIALLIVSAVGGGFWFVRSVISERLAPPPAIEGQPGIASYANEPAPSSVANRRRPADFSVEAMCEPPKAFRPWTRWWWPGNYVDAQGLVSQLQELDRAGIGGVEIQPFFSGLNSVERADVLERVHEFDTPAYYANLHEVLRAAQRLGMQADLTHLSGFPGGGPQVSMQDGVQRLVFAEEVVQGGRSATIALPKPSPNASDYFNVFFELVAFNPHFANFAEGHEELVSVLAARIVSGERALNPVNVDDTLHLDPSSVRVLTSNVSGGELTWDVPEGRWALVAIYRMPSAEPPLLAAYQQPGNVVDHLRKELLIGHYNYAFGERTGLAPFYGGALRGIFNDSFEFRADRLTVPDIFREFEARRGYDLEPWLLALNEEGADNFWFAEILAMQAPPKYRLSDRDRRIVHDYDLTISDLFRENFVRASAAWAEARGLKTRTQIYGPNIDLIRANGAMDIPDTETLAAGGSEFSVKLASAAAALYDKELVGAEAFTFGNMDYQVTPRHMKGTADKLFAFGANHLVYHGTPYQLERWEDDPFGAEGWHPFSTPDNAFPFGSSISPVNPFWDDIEDINRYLTRAQFLLRAGEPDWDVLVYYPFLGFGFSEYLSYTDHESFVMGGLPEPGMKRPRVGFDESPFSPWIPRRRDERADWLARAVPLAIELAGAGITWNWINGHALLQGEAGESRFRLGDRDYGAIVLFETAAIEPAEIGKLVELARAGVPVYVIGSRPGRTPGYHNFVENDELVRRSVEDLAQATDRIFSMEGIGAAVANLKAEIELPVSYAAPANLLRASRKLAQGGIHFFANQTADTVSATINVKSATAFWFDAMSGQFSAASMDAAQNVRLQLATLESRFLLTGMMPPATLVQTGADLIARQTRQGQTIGPWNLTASLAHAIHQQDDFELVDWRTVPELKYSAGPGRYTTTFHVEDVAADQAYILDLGLVHGTADVSLNGARVGRAVTSPFLLDVTERLRPGANEIAVNVRVPLHNSLAKKALDGDSRYLQFRAEAEADDLTPAGLAGPTSLVTVPIAGESAYGRCAP